MIEYFQNSGIQNYLNPMSPGGDGNLIHAVNVISFPYYGKSKRPGYGAFLGTSDGSVVNSLLAFPRQDGSTLWLYRASGTQLQFSQQGTGPWTPCAGDNVLAPNAHFGAATLNDTFIGGDGVGSTKYTTDGTTFIDASLAPVAPFFAQFQNAIYCGGTSSTLFKSCDNDATNWQTSGTSNSTSFTVPDEGKLAKIFVTNDKLIATKNRGKMYAWDGNALTDLSTRYGPSSPYSIDDIEDYRFYVNQFGHFGFDSGNNIQLLSNPVQRFFYNRQNTGIQGTLFPNIPGVCHFYDYFAAIGTVTDDFTQRTIPNAILNYNYQKNEYLTWQLYDNPTAFLSYFDQYHKRQLIWANSQGQCFQLDRTNPSDNGNPINTELVFMFTYAAASEAFSKTSATTSSATSYEKKWNWIRLFFNPGCEVNIQGAFSNSFSYQNLSWFDINDNSQNPSQNSADGICEYRFPQDTRSRLLFIRIYDSSAVSQWTYYGCQIDATANVIR